MGHHQKRDVGLALSSISNAGAEAPCCKNTQASCGEEWLLHQRGLSRSSVVAAPSASPVKEAGPRAGGFPLLLRSLGGKVLLSGG